MSACLLIYDIPENAPVGNPSDQLRRIAVRVNLSCWIIPESLIPYHLLNTMAAGGATWHVVRFDASEAEKLATMARDAIRRDIKQAISRARASIARTDNSTDAAMLEDSAEAERSYIRRTRNALNRARRLVKHLSAAASMFGIDKESINLADAFTSFEGITAGVQRKAKEYAELSALLRNVDPALAATAAADELPVCIMMDRLEDAGMDMSSGREMFAEEPMAV